MRITEFYIWNLGWLGPAFDLGSIIAFVSFARFLNNQIMYRVKDGGTSLAIRLIFPFREGYTAHRNTSMKPYIFEESNEWYEQWTLGDFRYLEIKITLVLPVLPVSSPRVSKKRFSLREGGIWMWQLFSKFCNQSNIWFIEDCIRLCMEVSGFARTCIWEKEREREKTN